MAMSANFLKTQFLAMGLFGAEEQAAATWANAFDVYFKEAEAGVAGSINVAGLANCKSAMQSALAGMSANGEGANRIQAGILAYWGAINPALAWSTCTSITIPPVLSTLAMALIVVFSNNTVGSVSTDTAYQNIASLINTANTTGGIAVFPAPPTGIGPQPIT